MYSQMPVTAGAGPGQSQEPELNVGLPCRWQRHKYLSHHYLPPGVCVSRKSASAEELGFEPRNSD